MEIKVGVRTADSSTGKHEPKDIVTAIKTAVAGILMKRGAPGACSVTLPENGPVTGTLTFHPQPSEATGQMMYHVTGKLRIGSFDVPDFGGNAMLDKKDKTNFLDEDTTKLYQVARKANKGDKEIAKLTQDEVALLAKHGVILSKK